MMAYRTQLLSTGSYTPENLLTNNDLKQFPELSIRLIQEKTGIMTRRFASDNQKTSDLAAVAAKKCIESTNIKPREIDAIILATSSPDRIQPATATSVQYLVGAINAFAFDINSVCSGGIFALHIADSMVRAGFYKTILVIGAEIYSRYLNPSDFSTFPYFGDGAGAILLSAIDNEDKNTGVIHSILMSDGSKSDVIQIPAGGTQLPFRKVKDDKDFYFRMNGREVYEFAISKGTEIIDNILKITATSKKQIKYIIPHQANLNIIKELSVRTGIEFDKFVINLDKYGNTAAASIFIALDELVQSGKVMSNDLILLVAFGGGLSWGATLIRF